jgi:hypothetical protein
MRKIVTIDAEISTSVSWTLVEILMPKYSTQKRMTT